MARRTGVSGATTLKAIRRAGLQLMAEHGYEAMSLRQLAGKVGIQAGSLYNHIATKQALLVDLIRTHMEELIGALDAALAGLTDPAARLDAFVAFHVGTHLTKKHEVYVSTFELRALTPANYARIVKLRAAYEGRLSAILRDGVRQKAFDVADVRIATFALLAMLTGVCTWYRPRGRLGKSQIIALHLAMAQNFVRGRGPRKQASAVSKQERSRGAAKMRPGRMEKARSRATTLRDKTASRQKNARGKKKTARGKISRNGPRKKPRA